MLKRMAVAALFAAFVTGLSLGLDLSEIPNAFDNIKAGQWVTYKIMGGGTQKQSVVKAEGKGRDAKFTVKYESPGLEGMPTQEQEFTAAKILGDLENGLKNATDVKMSKTKITVNGKEYDVTMVESDEGGMKTKAYLSNVIPVTALVKMEMEGLDGPLMELLEYGE